MADVLAFRDGALPGEPDQGVIEEIERLLEEAKSGELRAFAFATVLPNRLGTGWAGAAGTRNDVGMAISLLAYRYPQAVMDQE